MMMACVKSDRFVIAIVRTIRYAGSGVKLCELTRFIPLPKSL